MKKFISVFILVCLLFTTCYAKPEIAYNNETRDLYLSGNSSHKNSDVSLRVFKKSDTATPSDFANVLLFYQLETDENGDYLGQFTMPGDATSGYYIVYVSDEENGEFYLAIEEEINACIKAFSETDENTIEATLKLYGQEKNVLGVSLSGDYSLFPKWSQKAMVEFIKEKKPENLTDIINCYNKANEAAFLIAGDKTKVKKALTANLLQNEIEEGIDIDLLSETYVSSRQDISSSSYDKNLTDYIRSSLRIASAISCVNTSTKGVMTDVLEKYNDVLELDLDGKYEKVSKVEVNKALVKKNFTSLEQIKAAFNKSVSAVYKKNTSGQGSSGTGGSSGSSGGGSAVGFAPSVNKPAEPENESKKECLFKDIESVSWAKEAIVNLYGKGIISGYSEEEFKPDNEVTRAEFTKLVVSLMDDKNAEGTVNFTDVTENDWFAPFVKKGVASGIINGAGTSFMPGSFITREDAAVIIYRFLNGKISLDKEESFADEADMAQYSKDAIKALSGAKIVNGMGNGCFMPKKTLTRAQAAVLINSVLNSLK